MAGRADLIRAERNHDVPLTHREDSKGCPDFGDDDAGVACRVEQSVLGARGRAKGHGFEPSGNVNFLLIGEGNAKRLVRNGPALPLHALLWYARLDSNQRPSAPEADALSTELRARA